MLGEHSSPRSRTVLVALLKQMGAIIIAKSNLPQSIMWCETENPLFGLTVHPMNSDFTPGGSTGGEGTLLSLQGSVVGWGTDIGGSIRIPSHMLGLYGLKPSSTRLPYQGVSVSTEGQEHVPSVIGPMSRNVETLIAVTKAVVDSRPWELDPKCCPLTWREEMFAEKPIDILLCPVMPHSAVPHRKCRWVGYAKVFNFVDYPSVVLPAGKVSRELDGVAAGDMTTYEPRNSLDEWNWNLFDVDAMDGMPIGVQVVARRLEEEKALGAAKVIDSLLKGTSTTAKAAVLQDGIDSLRKHPRNG